MKQIKLFLILILIAALGFSCASAGKENVVETDGVDNSEESAEDAGDSRDSDSSAIVISGDDNKEPVIKPAESPAASSRLEKSAESIAGEVSEDHLYESEKRSSGFGAAERVEPAPGIMADESFSSSSPAPGSASGLKAGYADDNRQYGYFLKFLEEYRNSVVPLSVDVSERITLMLTDADGKSVPGAGIKASADRGGVVGVTLADGSYQINPSELFSPRSRNKDSFTLEITGGSSLPGFDRRLTVPRNGARSLEISAETERMIPDPVPLDIVFVMDTTGSMGEEINRLKNTIQIIHMNLTSLSVAAEIRLGMVLYRDIGDEYHTQIIPLTSDIDLFQASLDKVTAAGGGDTPEDLEAALGELVNNIEWNPEAVKLSYVITDAAPHLDYQSLYTCDNALRDARKQGIKIFTIGTGGLDIQGEYNLRQIAQYTSARYIFLTYGAETGESSGGAPGSVSHHTGSNWSADKLESIIIRFTREELSHLSDSPLLDEDPWFEADKNAAEKAEEILAQLFDQALEQLLDFSTIPVSSENLLAVLPFSFEGELSADAEYFNEHLILTAGGNDRIKLAERKDLAQLLTEIEFQNIGVTDEKSVSRIGEFLNADILVSGNLFMKDGRFELFLKLLRVETAEILSVTRAVIDSELGL